jgi:hypothetical protein
MYLSSYFLCVPLNNTLFSEDKSYNCIFSVSLPLFEYALQNSKLLIYIVISLLIFLSNIFVLISIVCIHLIIFYHQF